MPEFRRDRVSQRWVIIAQDRAGRPSDYVPRSARREGTSCPFCAGHEGETPAALANYPPTGPTASPTPAWQVRVIPNKYPAARREPDTTLGFSPTLPSPGMATPAGPMLPGLGDHEVIIESPAHVASFTELTAEQAAWSFMAYRDRLRVHRSRPDLAYGLVFKNCRSAGGATLEHAHSQLLSTSFVPGEIERELQSMAEFRAQQGRCLFCDLVEQETAAGERMVRQSERWAMFCPFASRFPFETWLVPRRHQLRFEDLGNDEIAELSSLVRGHLISLESLFPDAAYNFWIHTAPFAVTDDEAFHWHVEIVPRVTTQAGYEWGSGCFVNPLSPEKAAQELRRIDWPWRNG